MLTQTDSNVFVVTQEAGDVTALLRKLHYCPRIITEFQGPICGPVFNSKGDMLYMPFKEEDKKIIPEAAYSLHEKVKKAGYRDLQVIIGHEIKVASEKPLIPSTPKPAIDWGNVAEVASKGLLTGMMGIVMTPIYALAGAVFLLDPSYCIVLDDRVGTIIELLRWNSEA
jgi:hypothetical protein